MVDAVHGKPTASRTARIGGLFTDRTRQYLLFGATALVVIYLAVIPVGTMVVASFQRNFLGNGPASWTARNYIDTYTSPGFGDIVTTSLLYAGISALLSLLIGFTLAWLVSCTNAPLKWLARGAALVPLLIPGILNTMAWALLLSPRIGALNSVFHAVGLPAFNVYSLAGMVFVQSTHTVPLAFLMGTAVFESVNTSFEEAALTCGSPPWQAVFRITVRLARPAIMSSFLLIFVQSLSQFEVPQLIGVPGHRFVFVSVIFNALQSYPPDYGAVGVVGVTVLALALLCLWASWVLNRRGQASTIVGKAFRPVPRDIGRWRWVSLAAFATYFVLVVLLPLAILVWSSLLPSYQPPSAHALRTVTLDNFRQVASAAGITSAAYHSAIAALISAAVVVGLAMVVAYITVKTKVFGRSLLDGAATVPLAVPSIIMGVGILYWYLAAPLPVHLYGSLAILVIAFVTISLPYGMRYIAPAMAQVHSELEEAAAVSGAPWLHVIRRVYVPLLSKALLAAFLYTVILTFREISAAIFLYSTKTPILAVTVYNYWSDGSYTTVAALGVLMIILFAILGGIYLRLLTNRGGKTGTAN